MRDVSRVDDYEEEVWWKSECMNGRKERVREEGGGERRALPGKEMKSENNNIGALFLLLFCLSCVQSRKEKKKKGLACERGRERARGVVYCPIEPKFGSIHRLLVWQVDKKKVS